MPALADTISEEKIREIHGERAPEIAIGNFGTQIEEYRATHGNQESYERLANPGRISDAQIEDGVENISAARAAERTEARNILNLHQRLQQHGYDGLQVRNAAGAWVDDAVGREALRTALDQRLLADPTTRAAYTALAGNVNAGARMAYIERVLRDTKSLKHAKTLVDGLTVANLIQNRLTQERQQIETDLTTAREAHQRVVDQIADKTADRNAILDPATGTGSLARTRADITTLETRRTAGIPGDITAANAQIDNIRNVIIPGLAAGVNRQPYHDQIAAYQRQIEALNRELAAIPGQLATLRTQENNLEKEQIKLTDQIARFVVQRDGAPAIAGPPPQPAVTGTAQKVLELEGRRTTVDQRRTRYEDEFLQNLRNITGDAGGKTIADAQREANEFWTSQKEGIKNERLRNIIDHFYQQIENGTYGADSVLDTLRLRGAEGLLDRFSGGLPTAELNAELLAVRSDPALVMQFKTEILPRVVARRIQDGRFTPQEYMRFVRSRHVGREAIQAAIENNRNIQKEVREAMDRGEIDRDFWSHMRTTRNATWFKLSFGLLAGALALGIAGPLLFSGYTKAAGAAWGTLK